MNCRSDVLKPSDPGNHPPFCRAGLLTGRVIGIEVIFQYLGLEAASLYQDWRATYSSREFTVFYL
jgi:hypothetical protein